MNDRLERRRQERRVEFLQEWTMRLLVIGFALVFLRDVLLDVVNAAKTP